MGKHVGGVEYTPAYLGAFGYKFVHLTTLDYTWVLFGSLRCKGNEVCTCQTLACLSKNLVLSPKHTTCPSSLPTKPIEVYSILQHSVHLLQIGPHSARQFHVSGALEGEDTLALPWHVQNLKTDGAQTPLCSNDNAVCEALGHVDIPWRLHVRQLREQCHLLPCSTYPRQHRHTCPR